MGHHSFSIHGTLISAYTLTLSRPLLQIYKNCNELSGVIVSRGNITYTSRFNVRVVNYFNINYCKVKEKRYCHKNF